VTQPALVVMAAGIGSRYGGLKQVDPIGPGGEIVIDYAVYDALRAGFEQVIFVIRREIEDVFREKIGGKIEKRVETAYVFQELDDLPPGFQLPENRKKPWGTGHAVLSCRDVIDRPFAVINADDFYSFQAFQDLANYLHHASDQNGVYDFAMVGYALSNTLSEHGSVARGVCQVSVSGYLEGIQERTRIEPREGQIMYTENGADWTPLSADSIVSMNMWGFTPSMITELAARFPIFLQKNAANIEKAEYFLPSVVNDLLQEGKARVRVLPVKEKWYGVTYPQDRAAVQEAVRELVRRGLYPENLWA
jgi:dTDP-glucose pyrophosphorylase